MMNDENWSDHFYGMGRGRGLNLQGGAHATYFSRLELYATAEETLICIALSYVSEIYSIFIIMIVVMIIIIVQCCHIVSLWFSGIGKIWECQLYFAPPLPRGFDHFCSAGQDGAGNHPFSTAVEGSLQGGASIPAAYIRSTCSSKTSPPCRSLLIFLLKKLHRILLKKVWIASCNCIEWSKTNVSRRVGEKWCIWGGIGKSQLRNAHRGLGDACRCAQPPPSSPKSKSCEWKCSGCITRCIIAVCTLQVVQLRLNGERCALHGVAV